MHNEGMEPSECRGDAIGASIWSSSCLGLVMGRDRSLGRLLLSAKTRVDLPTLSIEATKDARHLGDLAIDGHLCCWGGAWWAVCAESYGLALLGVVGKGTSASGLRVHLVLVAFVTKGMWASWAASSPYCAGLASLEVPGARSVVTIRHCAPTAGVRCGAHRRVRRNDTVRASCGLRVIAHQGDVYSAVRHRDSVWWAHYGLHCGHLAECKRGPAAE